MKWACHDLSVSSYRRPVKIALLSAILAAAGCRSSDPTGVWEIQSGNTAKGGNYVGVVHFDPEGDHWKASWNTSFDDQDGTAVREGSLIAACYAERSRPSELWMIKRKPDGSAVLVVYRGEAKTESVLTGNSGTLIGSFKVADSGDELVISNGKDAVEIVRNGKGRVTRAVGFQADNFIAAAAGDLAGIALYTIRGGSAEGRRYSIETGLRTEKLERAATGSMNVKFKGRFKP